MQPKKKGNGLPSLTKKLEASLSSLPTRQWAERRRLQPPGCPTAASPPLLPPPRHRLLCTLSLLDLSHRGVSQPHSGGVLAAFTFFFLGSRRFRTSTTGSKASMSGSVRSSTGSGLEASTRYVRRRGMRHGWERPVDVYLLRGVHTLQLRKL